MKTCRTLFIVSIIAAILTCCANGGTIYVDASATGANNGSSWMDAFVYLQDGLATAVSGDEIWVAAGTYKPDHGAGVTIGDRLARFHLKAGVGMYGGFPVGGGTKQQRNPNAFESILSGDLNSDDQPNFLNYDENSFIICYINWSTGATVLDGFTIKAANIGPNYGGSALYNSGGQMTVVNCKFLNNYSPDPICGNGVAIRFFEGANGNETLTGSEISNCLFQNNVGSFAVRTRRYSPVFRDCLFKQNNNGAVICEHSNDSRYIGHSSNPKFINCTFIGNNGRAVEASSFLAWPNIETYTNPMFINCEFIGNSAPSGYGTMYIRGECTSLLVNCVFVANSESAIYSIGMSGGGKTSLYNCTISGNTGSSLYGGILTGSSDGPLLELANCILWGNYDFLIRYPERSILRSCCIQDSDPNDEDIPFGGATNHNIDDNPRFIRESNPGADGMWGTADDDYGDLHLQHISPCIDSGDNASVPADTTDFDGDGNTSEPIPYDLDGRARILDGDCNNTQTVDMGAYEFSYTYLGDFSGGCDVDFADFAVLASAWLTTEGQAGWNGTCDIALPTDGIIDVKDFEIFAENWLIGSVP